MFQILFADSGLPASEIKYESANAANDAARELRGSSGQKIKIARIVTEAWRLREASRLASGEYASLPHWWIDAGWWKDSAPEKDHFLHMAEDGKRVAFTESPEKGESDKQLTMSATKYLARYFSESLAGEEIAALGIRLVPNDHEMRVSFDPEDFARIYENMNHPYSCMRHSMDHFRTSKHPAYVYGAGDLQIAWIQDGTDTRFDGARAVIYPQAKRYPLIYGTTPEHTNALAKHLMDAGYEQGNLTGAKMLRIEEDDGFIVPYLDGCVKNAEDDGEYLIISRDGSIDCETTSGISRSESRYTCDNCGSGMDEEECNSVQGDSWCDSCYSNSTVYCERTEESFPDSENMVEVYVSSRYGRGELSQTWCEDAAHSDAFECDRTGNYYSSDDFTAVEVNCASGDVQTWCSEMTEGDFFHCGFSGEDYSHGDFTSIEVTTRNGDETWCEEASENDRFTCEDCGEVFSTDMRAKRGLIRLDVCEDCEDSREDESEDAQGFVSAPCKGLIQDTRQIELAL